MWICNICDQLAMLKAGFTSRFTVAELWSLSRIEPDFARICFVTAPDKDASVPVEILANVRGVQKIQRRNGARYQIHMLCGICLPNM